MATRKTATLNPIKVCMLALKQVKSASDYHQLSNTSPTETLTAAWNTLSEADQQRITEIINNDVPFTPQAIAEELAASGNKIQLEAVKAHHGELALRQAWRLLEPSERIRIKALCNSGQKEEVSPVTEQPATYQVKPQPQPVETPTPRRTLFNISDDLQHLNDLLDDCGDDAQQQQMVNDWLEQLGNERDCHLDNYSALVVEMATRAAARKAEAQRLMELVAADENKARLLRDRLKWFFETHDLKTVDTARYRLSVAKNGGKAPLILDESVPVTKLPEQYQKVSIDANTAAIREALEAGEVLQFAHLGERGTSLRIK